MEGDGKKGKNGSKRWIVYIFLAAFFVLLIVLDVMDYKKAKPLSSQPKEVNTEKADIEEGKRFTAEDLAYLRERSKTVDGKYTGIGKGKNLIVIQVEALQDFVIGRDYDGQEITPNLNKLIDEGPSLYFDKYFELIGRGKTSDAEFVSNNSLYPSMEDQSYTIYENNTFYGLPWILRDNGYTSWAFHGYEKEFWNRDNAYPNQGFERYISEEDFDVNETIGFGMVDEDFFDQSISYLKQMDKPFHAFMITLTSHNPFEMPEKYEEINLREEHKGTILGNYIQSIHYADEQIGRFIERLKEEGLYDDTVISIYGDHFAIYTQKEEYVDLMTDYLGYHYDFDEMMRIPLIIHLPGTDVHETISNVGSQLDFLPTILNIMGIENEKGVMFGRDIVNSKEGFAPQQMYAMKGSYIDNEKMFDMSRDGIYDHSRAFYLDSKKPVDLKKCREGYERAIREIDKCAFLLENDLIKDIIDGKEDFSDVEVENLDIENDDFVALGGGKVNGISSSNSKEALDESYRNGFRMMEVDFQWTSDDELVLLNDWEESFEKLFSADSKQYSHDEFMDLDMKYGLHQMDLEKLVQWMNDHEDAYIVTDIKTENIKALKDIDKNYPDIKERIIPQIYCTEDFYIVRYVYKYKNVILNLRHSNYTDEQIIDFMELYKHFAVTMPRSRGEGELPKKLEKLGVPNYVYEINEEEVRKDLKSNGVYGIYTDELKPINNSN